MNIDAYFKDKKLLLSAIKDYTSDKVLRQELRAKTLTLAHLDKAKHNLRFVNKNISDDEFNDWTIVALYYAVYHACLALIAKKGYISKNHTATLLVLIQEYSISKEEATLIQELYITKDDAELYTELKEHRRNASYATNTLFKTENVKSLQKQVITFINKTEELLNKK